MKPPRKIQFIHPNGKPKGKPVVVVEIAEDATDISELRAISLIKQGKAVWA